MNVFIRIAFYLVVAIGLLSLDVFANSVDLAQVDSNTVDSSAVDSRADGSEQAAAKQAVVGSAGERPSGKVQLKPSLCIVKRGAKSCRIDLDVRWSASQTDEYCVFKQDDAEPLQCWKNHASGQHTDALLATSNQNYRLVWLSDSAKVALGQAVLQVVNVVPDDRRKQRRRRHVWSVF